MRPDQPEVIVPPTPSKPEQPFDLRAFQAAYAAAGSPRVVLFWNRELTDRLALDQIEDERGSSWETQSHNPARNEHRQGWVVQRRITLDGQATRAGPQETGEWHMRSAYVQALLDGGVRLLDRNVIVRNLALQGQADAPDPQRIEAAAVKAQAGWLLEVLLARSDTDASWVVNSRLKRVPDGRVLAESVYVNAAAVLGGQGVRPSNAARYVADPIRGGYQKVIEPVLPGAAQQRLGKGAAQGLLTDWLASQRSGATPDSIHHHGVKP